MSELKPCPFCGNDRNIALTNEKHDHSGGYFIACPECDASTGLRYAMGDDPRPLLIEAWNRRAQPAQAGQVLTTEVEKKAAKWDAINAVWQHKDAKLEDLVAAILRQRIEEAERHHGIVGEQGGAT